MSIFVDGDQHLMWMGKTNQRIQQASSALLIHIYICICFNYIMYMIYIYMYIICKYVNIHVYIYFPHFIWLNHVIIPCQKCSSSPCPCGFSGPIPGMTKAGIRQDLSRVSRGPSQPRPVKRRGIPRCSERSIFGKPH